MFLGVGKSKLLCRFVDKKRVFTENSTVGIDIQSTILNISKERVKLQIWDTAGQEKFRSITANFYRGSIFILLFVTSLI